MKQVDEIGSIVIYNSAEDRYELLVPKIKISGSWEDSDISAETEEVQEFCKAQWTDEIKDAYTNHIDTNKV